jgi:hypothetical protein
MPAGYFGRLRGVGPRPPRTACGGRAQVNDCTKPCGKSLLLDEVPEVVVIDHLSAPDIAT